MRRWIQGRHEPSGPSDSPKPSDRPKSAGRSKPSGRPERETGVPLVATNDIHYIGREEQLAQEVLLCIGNNKTLQDENRYRLGSDQFYFKSEQEMRDLFHDMPEVCDRTNEIAARCDIKFHLKDEKGAPIYHLPSYPTSGNVSLKEEISNLAHKGLERRFKEAEERQEPVPEDQRGSW